VSLIERVNAILHGVVTTVVMPSFRALRPEDIHLKDTPGDPDDLVTSADEAAERYLIDALRELVPGAAFIGEEGVSENPALVAALSGSAPAWLIDPIDGTKNFARGASDFGVMIALVEGGVTRASWIAVPAAQPSGYVMSAERGRGTHIDGVRVSPTGRIASTRRGTIHTRMMPGDAAADALARLRGKYAPVPSTGAAATEYSAIVRGEKDFVIYYRLLPWDHAPGALAITEAAGVAVHVTGEPYAPLSPNQVTIFAATPELAETIRAFLI